MQPVGARQPCPSHPNLRMWALGCLRGHHGGLLRSWRPCTSGQRGLLERAICPHRTLVPQVLTTQELCQQLIELPNRSESGAQDVYLSWAMALSAKQELEELIPRETMPALGKNAARRSL